MANDSQMEQSKTNWKPITIISLLLFTAAALFVLFAPQQYVSRYTLFVVPFLYVMTMITRLLLARMENTDNANQKLYHVAASLIKMFIYLIVLIAFGIFGEDNIASFFISFLLFYLIYMYLDVRYQVRSLSGQ